MEQKMDVQGESRLHWLANLRSVVIFLVVLYHCGGVYEGAGLWGSFWIVDDPDTMAWVGIMGIVFDIFVMSTLFMLSGYLAAKSLKHKTPSVFIRSRFRRLFVPWLIAVVTLIPLYKVIFLYSRGLPQETWTTYFHISNPNSQNWLWFLPVLLLFDLIYAVFPRGKWEQLQLSLWKIIPTVGILALLSSMAMGTWLGMRSWTLTPLLDFENERLILYFLSFLFGTYCFNRGIFSKSPGPQRGYIIASSLAWIPLTAHIIVRLIPFFDPEGFQVTSGYQWMWWISFDLSLGVMMYTMVETFRRYFDKPGPLWQWLNQNSYGVYVTHVIFIGLIGTLLLGSGFPVWLKYLLLISMTYLLSNGLTAAYQRIRSR